MGLFKKHLHPLLSRKNRKDNDPNSAFIDAIDDTLRDVEGDIIESKIHSSLKTAKGWSLDEYGSWFGLQRNPNESDSRYRRRLINYISIPKGTNAAIKWAVRNYLKDLSAGVEVYEPFKDIFFLNSSKLNGTHHLMGYNYRFAVIRVDIGVPFDDRLIEYLQDFIPSGVRVHVNYDPSIPRTNQTSTDTSASLFSMNIKQSDLHAETYTGLERYIGGRIQMGDDDSVMESFITNRSQINSEDVLTGSFTKDRELYHVFGIGRDIKPSLDSRIGELYGLLEDFEEVEYKYLTNIHDDSERVSIGLSPADEVYQVWNIDKYMHSRYYGTDVKVPRTREGHSKLLKGSEFTLSTEIDSKGKSYDFEVYNFTTRRWVNLKRIIGMGVPSTIHAELKEPYHYLNENRLMLTRIKVNDALNMELNYLSLDYRVKEEA